MVSWKWKKNLQFISRAPRKNLLRLLKCKWVSLSSQFTVKNWNCGFYKNTNIQWWLQKPNFIPGNDKLWERISQNVSVFKQ